MSSATKTRTLPGSPLLASPRHALRRVIMMHPTVYLPLARWKRAESMLGASTDLVIDGFERSANTFAVIAFQLAQNDHVRVAHHMHAAAAVLAATSRRVPTLVTVREPEPAIVSAVIREPQVTLQQWMKTYAALYERIAPSRERFVVAEFDQVTADFGAVIGRVNERFGTDFREFQHTPANVEAVFALIDERAEGPPWQPSLNRFISGLISADEYLEATRADREANGGPRRIPEHRIQRPSDERKAVKVAMLERYRDPALARLRARVEDAYRAVVG